MPQIVANFHGETLPVPIKTFRDRHAKMTGRQLNKEAMKVLHILLIIMYPLLVKGQGAILYIDTFDYEENTLPCHWWSEGVPAYIKNGRMFVDADTIEPRVSTIWLDKEFSGNMSIEFDVHVTSSFEMANNINFFFMYSHPEGHDLRESLNERSDGRYSRYHVLNGYIFTHLANGQEVPARFRFRHNPGFNLVNENFDYECKLGKTYQVKIVKKDNRIQYWTDGKLIFNSEIDDSRRYEKGILGFRTYRTSLWWDNLVVRQLD